MTKLYTGRVIQWVMPMALLYIWAVNVEAATFNVSVSPPRFEKKVKLGKIMRDVIRIQNLDKSTGRYHIRSADWFLLANGSVKFNEGKPDKASCRPWIRIERHMVSIPSGASKSYRFEVHVPANAVPGECRFAILISSDPKTIKPVRMGKISIPIVGRIGVIVYLRIGDAKPALSVQGFRIGKLRGKPAPFVVIKNAGKAHGRPSGTLRGKDAKGRRVDLVVNKFPILPGETRAVGLQPVEWTRQGTKDISFKLRFPMQIRGKIEWDGGSVKIDKVIR